MEANLFQHPAVRDSAPSGRVGRGGRPQRARPPGGVLWRHPSADHRHRGLPDEVPGAGKHGPLHRGAAQLPRLVVVTRSSHHRHAHRIRTGRHFQKVLHGQEAGRQIQHASSAAGAVVRRPDVGSGRRLAGFVVHCGDVKIQDLLGISGYKYLGYWLSWILWDL